MTRVPGDEQRRLFEPPPPVYPLGKVWGYFWSTPRGQDVKHGITNGMVKRRRDLQTGNPEDLVLMGAYPDYSKCLEDAVKDHFAHLRKPGTEWFATNSLELKIVALGDGLPFEIVGGITTLSQSRQELVNETVGASIDMKLGNLQIWSDRRHQLNQQNKVLAEAMMALTGSKDEWRARQPIQVQIKQLWSDRLNGDRPFDLRSSSLQPSRILDLLELFRRIEENARLERGAAWHT